MILKNRMFAFCVVLSIIILSFLNAATGLKTAGDINGDGEFDANDIVVVRRILLGDEFSKTVTDKCNVNGDDSTDILDLVAIKRMLVDYMNDSSGDSEGERL